MSSSTRLWIVFCSLVAFSGSRADSPEESFEKHVRPLLTKHCIACHGPDKQKSGLRLDSKIGWEKGGESGPAIVPGDPDKSLFIRAIRHVDGVEKMPPTGKLSDQEIAALTTWVKSGAFDPRVGVAKLGGQSLDEAKKWWAFQPVTRPTVPGGQTSNAVDAFLSAKLTKHRLSLSPAADKRTLIRRATYDLTGLPPTPAEVDAFVNDRSADAFAKLVDRLLASPRYGERWGRHWLDLVRYADTAGENSDHPLPHAWRYRNWVIDSFNRDQPYDEFLREQIAGDLMAAQGPPEQFAKRIIATGFLAMARRFDHDSDKSMHLTHEDGIDTIGKALMGLTLGCARCHDHKYDAITAKDYYALYGILDSSRFSFPGCEAKQQPRDMVPLMPPDQWNQVVKPYQAKMAKLQEGIQKATIDQHRHSQTTQSEFTKSRKVLSKGEIVDNGEKAIVSEPTAIDVRPGEMILLSITPLSNHGADTTLIEFDFSEVDGQGRRWNATSDLLTDFLAGNPHADSHGNKAVWWLFDARNQPTLLPESIRDLSGNSGLHVWRNGDTPSAVLNSSGTTASVWTKLPPRSLFLHPAPNGNIAIGWLSPIAGKVRIAGKVKDAHQGGPDGVGFVLEHFASDHRPTLLAQSDAASKLRVMIADRNELQKQAPRQDVAFAVVEGKPADTKMHLRGDPEKLGPTVPRRWLEVFGGAPLKQPAESGRRELAEWIASPSNPLTARVMANRIWLHHFGSGLVRTPNDFGTRGSPPTHPELLDWLASELVRTKWSIKSLHRTIMLSSAYQQASAARDDAMKTDPTNELMWRFERRRLSAEELRDSLLATSEQLDLTPAEAHPFPPESTWSYSQHVPFSTFFETNKRSVYLVTVRNRRHPFLGLFDGADPNATTPQRQVTTVPTQALYFLNDPFFHQQALKVAEHTLARPEPDRVDALFRRTLQRSPSARDRQFVESFLKGYPQGPKSASTTVWAALSRVILASNEFLFVE